MHAPMNTDQFYFFEREPMMKLADELSERYRTAEPFEHVVIDDFLPASVAAEVAGAFPALGDIKWEFAGPGDTAHSGDSKIEKVSSSDEEAFPPYIRLMMMQLQSGIFCRFLDRLTGHDHLIPDGSHFGCGLHSTGSGGRLMMHVDASRHPNKDLNQLVNCIYYCTPDWQEEWGGHLELWDANATRCVARIVPRFNRLVIFRVSGASWHGQPHPVTAPPGVRRNSLALYYYTTKADTTGYEYSNFVRWKAVTEHDHPTGLHRLKAAIRDHLPTGVINAAATIARKTGLNFKR